MSMKSRGASSSHGWCMQNLSLKGTPLNNRGCMKRSGMHLLTIKTNDILSTLKGSPINCLK